ncbi:nodulation protein NfeD [Noviherbaspirillum sp. UKPF54]|uniref:NfeD family protein n=1 Tax=Noviherbaspirillum sp. UKPF54 TaxID=2601898 RepID=UPI0011B15A8D|nr:nodulation protein NfeD [Noviherbaspirillum sp. UKPF54]QDZ27677.1 nodulation protein NfeD [Noviherbaspirillum sp. UKPF54]
MIRFFLLHGVFATLLSACWPAASAPAAPVVAPVAALTSEGAIGPAAADYISRGLAHAARDGAQLVILRIDTPGGLDTSMRTIIKAILGSPVPVATYVAPSGARAASAGTYILYASHIAAMAPGTNLGAATPVRLGGGPEPEEPQGGPAPSGPDKKADKPPAQAMTRKQVNDAAAYIRGLAQLRGRNMEWAEQAVREAVSLSAQDALRLHVVDYVATDPRDLMRQAHGRKFALPDRTVTLDTAQAPLIDYLPDWRVRLLAAITDPSLALVLMTIGIYGLIFEFMNPGIGVPGVLGAICLLVALYGLQLLPVNYAGLALILLGIGFMVAEAFLPTFGSLGIGGVAAFIVGALILIDTDVPGFGIPLALIAAVAVMSAALIAALAGVALKTRRRAVVSGAATLIGAEGEVVAVAPGGGWARVGGELWRVTCPETLRRGQTVRVAARDGLVLRVASRGEFQGGRQ